MAGNSWVLRAFCEYYKWKKDEKVKEMIAKIVNNLLLTSKGNYSKYPLDPVGWDRNLLFVVQLINPAFFSKVERFFAAQWKITA